MKSALVVGAIFFSVFSHMSAEPSGTIIEPGDKSDPLYLKHSGLQIRCDRLDGVTKFEITFDPPEPFKSDNWSGNLVIWKDRENSKVEFVNENKIIRSDKLSCRFTIADDRIKDADFRIQDSDDGGNSRFYYEFNLNAFMEATKDTAYFPEKTVHLLNIDILGLKIGNTRLGETLHPKDSPFKPLKKKQSTSGEGYVLEFDDKQLLGSVHINIPDFKGSFISQGKKIQLSPATSIQQLAKLFRKPDMVTAVSRTREVAHYFLRDNKVEVVFLYDDSQLTSIGMMDFRDLDIAEFRKKEIREREEGRKGKE